jgi:lysophospholipid acyltransferase (LPLAT)-like uncharacterized protein
MSKVFPPILYVFLIILKSTLRIHHVNNSPLDETLPDSPGFIVCFWHSRLLMMPFARKWGPVKVLISRHRDGEFIARVIQFFKVGTIRGSYQKISLSSLREIINNLKTGIDIAITPDGPKGPRYKIKNGVIDLGQAFRKNHCPLTYGAVKKTFRSWDRFILPYPFSKIVFLWGEPLPIGRNLSPEEFEKKKTELEETLISLTEKADRIACGK